MLKPSVRTQGQWYIQTTSKYVALISISLAILILLSCGTPNLYKEGTMVYPVIKGLGCPNKRAVEAIVQEFLKGKSQIAAEIVAREKCISLKTNEVVEYVGHSGIYAVIRVPPSKTTYYTTISLVPSQ